MILSQNRVMTSGSAERSDSALVVRTRLNEQGRVVIPAAIRCAAGIEPGDPILVTFRDGRIEISSIGAALERIWALTEHLPHDGSVSESLIAERRAEAARDG